MKKYSQKIASLEFMRIIAIFAVIVIHTSLFIDSPIINGQPWLAGVVNQLSRFAVPFFFLLSGFLIQPKLISSPMLTMRRYNKPLLKIWLIWTVICLLLPTNFQLLMTEGYVSEQLAYWNGLLEAPLNSVLEGGLEHLWFLPALMIAVALIAFFVRLNLLKLLIPVSIVFYLYGVLAGSYASLTEIYSPFMTRNGPFFSWLMVVIGFEIRRREFRLSTRPALLLLFVGLFGHFTEAYWLFTKEVAFSSHDFLFFTPLWAAGLFFFLLSKPDLGDHPLTYSLSKNVLPIYVSHLSIAIVFYNIVGFFALSGLFRDALMLFGTIICTLLFVKLIEKTALQKYLFR